MLGSGGQRVRWPELPAAVHAAVAEVLGAPVVEHESQAGGFSPGSADRVATATGARAFVKAVSAAQNPDSPAMHRAEARVGRLLPAGLPVPRLLGAVEVEGWVVLVQEDVAGRTPHLPWRPPELRRALDALHLLAERATPSPVADLPTAALSLDENLRGADRLPTDGTVEMLRELSARARGCLDGRTLVHSDLRADNILLTTDGAVLVDWPWACTGPPWLDTLLLLMEVDRHGGHDVDALLCTEPRTRDVDPADLTAVLGGFAGFFLDAARRPAPPGLPRLREFQRVQGKALLRWVERRLR